MMIIIIIIIMNKSQETMWAPEIDFRHKTEARKVIVDFKFIASGKSSYKEPPEVVLVEKFVLVGGAVCAIPT